MFSIDQSVDIRRPPEAIFDFVAADVRHEVDRDPLIK
jgi:hypothetical protein